jgi:hypothetical protein
MPSSRARVASWGLAVATSSVLLVGLGTACKGSDAKGSDGNGSDAKSSDAEGSDAKGSDSKGSDAKGNAEQGSSPEGGGSRPPKPATRVMQVAAANYNACVRFDNGSVSCWGRCSMGCDVRSHETSTGLREIAGVADALDVAVGDSFACVAQGDGRVRCWGSNFYGALGAVGIDWAATPREVEGLTNVVEVEASQTMTCARTGDGEVWAWGGVADASPPPPDSTRRPRAIPQIRGATGLSSDPWGCCAALGDGVFACVGDGAAEATRRPTRSGACGCGLDSAGTLRCEMRSRPGPPTIDGTRPKPPLLPCSIDAIDGVREFLIAGTGGYAIRNDGELWRWGGVDRWGSRSELARMTALPKVRSIATGVRGAVLAVDDAGVLWGWGWSYEHGITQNDEWIEAPVRIWAPPG